MTIIQAKRKQSDQTWTVKYFWHVLGPHFTLYSLKEQKKKKMQPCSTINILCKSLLLVEVYEIFTDFQFWSLISQLTGCFTPCPFAGSALIQSRKTTFPPNAVMLQSTQCSQARSAKRVRGNAEEQRVECSIDVPEWKWQVGFQDIVDRMDGVRPNNHIHLHQWGGNIWKITNEKGHYSCTCKTKKWPYVIYSMASTRPSHLQCY